MDLVTGGSGFVGAHVVRALLDRGRAVRCLVRPGSDRRNLEGLDVEFVEGDLLEADSLRRPLQGVEWLFHVAADYRLFVRRPEVLYRANVGGTRALLRAAADAGVERVGHRRWGGARGLRSGGE
ncbi:MAG: NAD-dependent epimerase/dehydratase family protein, partial [Planctomycetota bacterium]